MLSKLPYFFVKISTLCIMQEKNYRFIMTIYCDSVKSYLQNEPKNIKKC